MKRFFPFLGVLALALLFLGCKQTVAPDSPATYATTYLANGATAGSVPIDSNVYAEGASVTVLGNSGSLVKAGYTFSGWNTQPNGLGTAYAAGSSLTMGSTDVSLFAVWGLSSYSVTYSGGGNTGGSVPTDSSSYLHGAVVTVLGNTGSLVKTGDDFAAWNTLASGLGITYSAGEAFTIAAANVTLYPIWIPSTLVYSISGKNITITNFGTLVGSLAIPGGVTAIAPGSLTHSDLTSVTIPASVVSIGASAFNSSSSLASVTLEGSVVPTLPAGSLAFTACAAGLQIRVPMASLGAYKSATGWSDYALKMVGY